VYQNTAEKRRHGISCRGLQAQGPTVSYSNLFKPLQTSSNLFKPLQTSSNLFELGAVITHNTVDIGSNKMQGNFVFVRL
jgi:hypothetical protein